MRRLVWPALIVLLGVGGLVMWMVSLSGCPSPKEARSEAAYGAQLTACVEAAKTLEESKACRSHVDAQWGLLDGGAQ